MALTRFPENIQSLLIGGCDWIARGDVTSNPSLVRYRVPERFPPGNLSSLPIIVRTIKANNSPRGDGEKRDCTDRSGTGQIEWKDKVSALHIFECVHFPGRTHRRSRLRRWDRYRCPTRVGNNNGHWPSAIPEYSALLYDDSIWQWPIPPDNALVKRIAVGEKGWLQNRGAQRPLTLPPRKSVGEILPLFNRRDSFRAGAFSRTSFDNRMRSRVIFDVKVEYVISILIFLYHFNLTLYPRFATITDIVID